MFTLFGSVRVGGGEVGWRGDVQNLRWRCWVEGWGAEFEGERLGGGVGCRV